jgi:hypothetical protein
VTVVLGEEGIGRKRYRSTFPLSPAEIGQYNQLPFSAAKNFRLNIQSFTRRDHFGLSDNYAGMTASAL